MINEKSAIRGKEADTIRQLGITTSFPIKNLKQERGVRLSVSFPWSYSHRQYKQEGKNNLLSYHTDGILGEEECKMFRLSIR